MQEFEFLVSTIEGGLIKLSYFHTITTELQQFLFFCSNCSVGMITH